MKNFFFSILFFTAILVTGSALAASSTNYAIPLDAITSGGAQSTSTNYQLFDAIGETQGAQSASTNFLIRSGVSAAIQKIISLRSNIGSALLLTSPPSSPTNVTAKATAKTITLRWIDPSSSDFSIEILRDHNPAAGVISGNHIDSVAKGVQQYVDTTVSSGTRYMYQIRTVDSVGRTALSGAITVTAGDTSPVATPIPDAPVVPSSDDVSPVVPTSPADQLENLETAPTSIQETSNITTDQGRESEPSIPGFIMRAPTPPLSLLQEPGEIVNVPQGSVSTSHEQQEPVALVAEPSSAPIPSRDASASSFVSPEPLPSSFLITAPAGIFATNQPIISGQIAFFNAPIQITVNTFPVTAVITDASGNFSIPLPIRLPDGEHMIELSVYGRALPPLAITIDTQSPEPPSALSVQTARQIPSAVMGTMDSVITVSGSVVDDVVIVNIYDVATGQLQEIVPARRSFTATIPLLGRSFGEYELAINIRDVAGNGVETRASYTISDAVVSFACSDGIDNDADGQADYPNDPDCASLIDDTEGATLFAALLRIPVIRQVSTNVAVAAQNITTTATQEIKKVTQETVRRTVVVAQATEEAIAASAPVVAPALTVVAPAAIAMNPVAAANLPAIPSMAVNAFSWLFSALGLKKKRKNPWGMIYDAITKDPIGLAIVRLFDASAKRLLATQVTDKEGRFEFLVKPGQYLLEVVKTPYVFPSKIVSGKEDNDLSDVYHGEPVTIANETQGMHVNIPLDPEDPTKRVSATVLGQLQRLRQILGKASLLILILGTAMSVIIYAFTQTHYNLFILLIYISMVAYQTMLSPKKAQSWGTIFDALTLQPVPLALVHIIDPKYQRVIKSRLSNYYGQFTFLPGAGEYQLKVVKQGYAFPSATKVAIKKYHHLYYGEQVAITKKQPMIATDVPLDPVRSSPPPGPSGALRAGETSNGVDPRPTFASPAKVLPQQNLGGQASLSESSPHSSVPLVTPPATPNPPEPQKLSLPEPPASMFLPDEHVHDPPLQK